MTLKLCALKAIDNLKRFDKMHAVAQHVVHMLVPCTAAAHNPCIPTSACASPEM